MAQVEQLKAEESLLEEHALRLQTLLRQMAEDEDCKR